MLGLILFLDKKFYYEEDLFGFDIGHGLFNLGHWALNGETVRILRGLVLGFILLRRVFDELKFVYDFFELGESAEIKIVTDVKFLVHEVDELFGVILFFEDLLSEESLFLLFVLVHCDLNQFLIN